MDYLYTHPHQGAPLWVITQGNTSCDACGWLTGFNKPHYVNTINDGVHHCASCHPIGSSWFAEGDSERSTK